MNRALQPLRTVAVRRVGLRHESAAVAKYKTRMEHDREHAGKAAATWKNICIFVATPCLLAAGVNAYNLYKKHLEHLEHHPPHWVHYEYMNWRARPFFWGNNSLFFNPKVNHDANEDE
ncbi:mitochondrial cytochrome c oxidase subunit VIa [Hesseltinella vesiculosa]|uniref:Mitochondrial cytochrome c oxidase subunit VIa n=1 Tax=Hesseltinella vesiculosa TaxID=101127 RepID=A0A1X2GU39_9FUNG|nr:mitochondrial cytochrome c oxidase subunit VIa [Hesseltinella vesiculosa]